MLKKTITYETFDGEEKTEDFYFHLSKADIVSMEMTRRGGLKAYLENIIKIQDGAKIMEEFTKLIVNSVGQKSEDGTRFTKTKEIQEDFKSSPAYDVLFLELVTDASKAAEFVNGIVPKGLAEQVAAMPQGATPAADRPADPTGLTAPTPERRVLTQTEAREMDQTELIKGLAEGRFEIPTGPDAWTP